MGTFPMQQAATRSYDATGTYGTELENGPPLRRDLSVRPTFFRSAARGLHGPAKLTPEPHEARGAEAPDQRTAASRLLRRVGRPFAGRLKCRNYAKNNDAHND
jgi:hypothetical protein